MANVVTTNPIVLDAAGVVSITPVTIKAIQVAFAADADVVLLSDGSGNAVYGVTCNAAGGGLNENLTVPGGIKCPSLTATTITAGAVVYLYLK
jgi:hypothetical protein